jgi:hypothetical protein
VLNTSTYAAMAVVVEVLVTENLGEQEDIQNE